MLETVGSDRPPRVHEPGGHTLLVADTDVERRPKAAAWVTREIARGAKVYYKGWFDRDAPLHEHWIVGPAGARGGQAALDRGQLELLDYPSVIERCGGTTEGLLRMQDEECRRALDQGWGRVAMSQETTQRPMADAAEAAEFARQERGYDVLATRWPLTTMCQLTVEQENLSATWESAAVHYRGITDGYWSSAHHDGMWRPRGELDAHVAVRFSAAVYGALRDALHHETGPDLHVDLAEVEFMDFACAQVLMLNARSASAQQRMILHRAGELVRHLILAAGRPRTVLFDDGTIRS